MGIKALYKEPKEEPIVININNDLEEYQKLVGGCIEVITLSYYDTRFKNSNIVAVIDDEGLLKGKEPNILLNNFQTLLVGNVVFVHNDCGEFVSLTKKEISKLKEVL